MMAKFRIAANAEVDMLTKEELSDALAAQARAPYQAVSFFRLPVITGTASGGVLSMGGDVNPEHTPTSGYTWVLRHLVIQGLTRGATPDAVQIFREQLVIWELNGNQYAQTFGRGEIVIRQGETLAYKNIGAFAATGQIIIHGTAWQVPSQLEAELVT
jgi:hypothetical protein